MIIKKKKKKSDRLKFTKCVEVAGHIRDKISPRAPLQAFKSLHAGLQAGLNLILPKTTEEIKQTWVWWCVQRQSPVQMQCSSPSSDTLFALPPPADTVLHIPSTQFQNRKEEGAKRARPTLYLSRLLFPNPFLTINWELPRRTYIILFWWHRDADKALRLFM